MKFHTGNKLTTVQFENMEASVSGQTVLKKYVLILKMKQVIQ